MTKRIESKYKVDRRYGCNLWGRPKSPQNRRSHRPGMHGQKPYKMSDFGLQLAAKQKLKAFYGNVSERQFRNIYLEAVRRRGDTGENIIEILERRLDAVVYRMKFAPTPFAARQIINHGHILVNGRRVNIPSYQVRDGDEIQVRKKMQDNGIILEAVQSGEREIPTYIEVDHKAMKGHFIRAPKLADVPFAVQMEPHMVVEYYSR